MGRPLPRWTDFAASPSPKLREEYKGRAADLFFDNENNVVIKWLHYLGIYDQLITPYSGSRIKMLKIGVWKRGSLDLWRKLLGAEAVIFGIDTDPSCAEFNGKAASVRIGSQDDPVFLRQIVAEMGGIDIVLDDGSHVASHQRTSFDVLFPLLSDGEGVGLLENGVGMHPA